MATTSISVTTRSNKNQASAAKNTGRMKDDKNVAGKGTKSKLTSAFSSTLLKNFERLTSIVIDDSSGEPIMPSLCSNMQHASPAGKASSGGGYCMNANNVSTETEATAPLNSSAEVEPANTSNNNFLASPMGSPARATAAPSGDDDKKDNNTGNFASWLASQEFDASAIVWNGDDVNAEDASGDEFASPAAVVVSTQYVREAHTPAIGKIGEIGAGGLGGNNEVHHQPRYPNEVDLDDGYVSISDMKQNKWPQLQLPDAVSDVWNSVLSTNWQCWQGQGNDCSNALNNNSMTGGKPSESSLTRARSAEAQNQKESLTIRRKAAEAAASNACVGEPPGRSSQRGRTYSDGARPPIQNISAKNNKPISILKKPSFGSAMSAGSSGGRPRTPSEDKTAESQDGLDDLVAKSSPDPSLDPSLSDDDKLKPINLEHALSRVSSRVVSSRACGPAYEFKTSGTDLSSVANSQATSVATPLVGEEFMSEHATPHRATSTTDTSTANSCTYSLSPGGPSGGARVGFLTSAALASAVVSPDSINDSNNDSFPYVTGQLPLEDDEIYGKDRDDSSDTPLMSEFSDNEKGSSDGGKWSKHGRRRRRMRMTK